MILVSLELGEVGITTHHTKAQARTDLLALPAKFKPFISLLLVFLADLCVQADAAREVQVLHPFARNIGASIPRLRALPQPLITDIINELRPPLFGLLVRPDRREATPSRVPDAFDNPVTLNFLR